MPITCMVLLCGKSLPRLAASITSFFSTLGVRITTFPGFGIASSTSSSSMKSSFRPMARKASSSLRRSSKVSARLLKLEEATKQEPEVRTATVVLLMREDRTDRSKVNLNQLASDSQRLLHHLRLWCYNLFLPGARLQRLCDVSRDVIAQRLRANYRQLREDLLILLEIGREPVGVS